MTLTFIKKDDSRFDTLKKGFNLRWPDGQSSECREVIICETAQDVVGALQYSADQRLRPTIRSGGHCYEGFVSNNPDGLIIDVGLLQTMKKTTLSGFGEVYRVDAGVQNWAGYVGLYKRYGKTLPSGSCYSVGSGGHISGGGYGLLSRRNGLTVDYLIAIDIVILEKGKAKLIRADASTYADLFRACRGAGGGNFGIITSYYFSNLPDAPKEVVIANIGFDWSDFIGIGGKEKFAQLLTEFGQYWVDNDQNQKTWGLFALFPLRHFSAKQFSMVLQYCDKDGTANDLTVYKEFIDNFSKFQPKELEIFSPPNIIPVCPSRGASNEILHGLPGSHRKMDWLYATQTYNASGANQRGKYKSSYMKGNFKAQEIDKLYEYLTTNPNDVNIDLTQSLVQIDSYGGKINTFFQNELNPTSVTQRSSVMKLQYQSYWTDPSSDDAHIAWMKRFYKSVYSNTGGIPYDFGKTYEGCYINYPDIDMLETTSEINMDWRELYYPNIVKFLDDVKSKYDPENVFRHAMSIWPERDFEEQNIGRTEE